MSVSAFPLQWPDARPRTPPGKRRSPAFSKKVWRGSGEQAYRATGDLTVADALERLQKELDALRARYVTVSSNVEPRVDGRPRSSTAAPADPGGAVYFRLGEEQHCLPCDSYRDLAQNIAAVAKHIEATRAIERYGVASMRDMFSGFAQIAPPAPKARPWWEVLEIPRDSAPFMVDAAFRHHSKTRHPDTGGSVEKFQELNEAYQAAKTEKGL